MAEDFGKLSDRELDALVAERVMGQIGWLRNYLGSVHSSVPHYSTDANAAFRVIETVYGHHICIDREIGGEWECTITSWDRDAIHVKHSNPARAICLAALAAQPKEPSE